MPLIFFEQIYGSPVPSIKVDGLTFNTKSIGMTKEGTVAYETLPYLFDDYYMTFYTAKNEVMAVQIIDTEDSGTSGYYYVSHEYIRYYEIRSTLKSNGADLISSDMVVNDIAVNWNATTLEISGSNLVIANNPNDAAAIGIHAPGITAVNLNGNPISNFTVSGDYIYVVGVPAWNSSNTLTSIRAGIGSYGCSNNGI